MTTTAAPDLGTAAHPADFWRHRRVAVTGATGFVGSHLVTALVDAGADVVVLVRDQVPDSPLAAGWKAQVAVVAGALESQPTLERMLAEYETTTVFHLGAQSQVGVANRNPVSTFEANIQGTWCLLEAARRTPSVAQVLIASSDKAYGSHGGRAYREDFPLNATHPYDVSKACGDMLATSYARSFGLPVVTTRCANFFGPGDVNWARLVPGTIRSLVRGERPVIRSDGTLTRDYLYVVDGVEAYLQLAEALADNPALAGEAFNFSCEQPLSVLQLVERLQDALGASLEPDVRNEASNEIDHQTLSADKARRMLGWTPRFGLDKGIVETVAWYRDFLTGEG